MLADRMSVQALCERALAGESLSRDDIVALLDLEHVETLEILRQAAEEGLRRWVGSSVRLFMRLPLSTHCRRDCLYCDKRRSNRAVERYRLDFESILAVTSGLQGLPLDSLVLDGMEDQELDAGFICEITRELEHRYGISPIPCLGRREQTYFEHLRSHGVDSYILHHKTSSPILYNQLHPEADFFDREQCLRQLLDLRFRVGTSLCVGLPYQDSWDLSDDIERVRELGLDTVIVAPFVPGSQTPLSDSPRGSVQRSLNAIAVARLVLRESTVLAGLSLSSLEQGSAVEALRWGANAVLRDLTPCTFDYEASGRAIVLECGALAARVHSLGRSFNVGS